MELKKSSQLIFNKLSLNFVIFEVFIYLYMSSRFSTHRMAIIMLGIEHELNSKHKLEGKVPIIIKCST